MRVNEALSDLSKVESGIPQGTVLGPPLFVIYIDDLEEAVTDLCLIMKFADDTKGLKEITCQKDREDLQMVLDKLVEWGEKWAMDFNSKRCKILHVGRNNPTFKYFILGEELAEAEEEKDIGVLVNKNMKPTTQCKKVAGTAGAVLRKITRNFHYRDKRIFKGLYCQYVRPHLEFASPAWSPWSKADIDLIEGIQKKAVNMVVGLRGRGYEEKCKELGLDQLIVRREWADLIQVYKIIHEIDRVDPNTLFTKAMGATRQTRQNSDLLNIRPVLSRLEVRKNSFVPRAINKWNALPAEIKSKKPLSAFKTSLKLLYRSAVEGAAAE